MSCLIDGLPDEVAIWCLACVPFHLHPKLQLVSRSWRAAFRSTELFKARREVGSSEELVCVLACEPENIWQAYDPRGDIWMTLPVMPSEISGNFGVASVARKLFVIGGVSDRVDPLTGDLDETFATNEVWSYDPILRQWAQQSPMLVRRAMFACCVVDGKIIVAGGVTERRTTTSRFAYREISTSKAEIYDPEKDMWEPLPDLCQTDSSVCSGVVIDGKMHVMHWGLSTVQTLKDNGQSWDIEDYGWLRGPIAVVHGEPYVFIRGLIVKQTKENVKVVSPASDFESRFGFRMIGVGDDIYMIGGVMGRGLRRLSDVDALTVRGEMGRGLRRLSDVDVLTVRGERPAWRPVAPMTLCRGSIRGCALLRI